MLQLFKERDRQNEMMKGNRQRTLDLSMQERFQELNMKDKFNEDLFRGEHIRPDLKNSAQAIQTKNCKQNLYIGKESLSQELDEMELKVQREEKMRQLLWERNPELRELRTKYLMANVTKDQVMQMAEKQALMELKRLEEKSLAEEARLQREEIEAEERRKEMEQFQAKLKYHRDLDDLRCFKKSRESSSGNEKEMERNAIDEILKKIQEENLEAEKRRIEKQRSFYKQTEEFLKIREEMQRQQKLKDQIDDLRVDEYRKAQELRAEEADERKQLCLEQRLQIQEKLLSYLEELCSEKLKQELLRTELAVEEKEAYEREREHDRETEKMKLRQDLQHLYEMQMRVKKQKEDIQKKEEELYRQNLMDKLYEQDKLELMSQQKRHLKKMEHLRVVKAMIEENRKRKAMEHERELAEQKYQESLESERAKMVNDEKIKFLRDHASGLLGYLPKGIFQSNEMIELVGDDFKKFYSRQACTK